MPLCPTCGTENPDRAKFCLECGRRLVEASTGESRRIVTVLFSDIVGSTSLAEELDPEALRVVLSRYFERMEAALIRHGGTVEKFIGDAIMAVFGMPSVHEDDALRAVRAGLEMRDALVALNEELGPAFGLTITTRTGIHTGEVVAGDASLRQTLVTGDAVNTAARLEQSAGPGEILLGETTWRLVRERVDAEPVAPIGAKGKAEPVRAARLLALLPSHDAAGRAAGTPMVGRDTELALMRGAYERVVADRRPSLVTVLGPAGVGKSRLVAESLEEIGDRATVLRGRCLSYGEGITYWPLREILQGAAGIRDDDQPSEARRKLETALVGLDSLDIVVARLATAIGLGDEPASQEEIFWATRRALGWLARSRPAIVVVEDIHWAEPTLLELLRDLVTRSQAAPILLICPAREELLERDPGWGQVPIDGVVTILLGGLPTAAAESLLDATPAGAAIPRALRDRILAAAEGDPLFVEEMARMLVDDQALLPGAPGSWGGLDAADVRVPPTIQALMAARVDGLPQAERSTAQRASVVGRVFEEIEVAELTPPEARPGVPGALLGLLRRELVAPEGPGISAADAYRFRHALIRDAAYEALRKAERAELHERFADWLERAAAVRLGEFEEIVGYHLGEAYRYRTELREVGVRTDDIGRRAAGHLHVAARRARARGDSRAAVRLYHRVGELPERGRSEQVGLLLDHSQALADLGLVREAGDRAEEALRLAGSIGDRRGAALARLLRLDVRLTDGTYVTGDPGAAAEVATAMADAQGAADPMALAQAWFAASRRSWADARSAESSDQLRTAMGFARTAGDVRLELDIATDLLVTDVAGPTPADAVVERARAVIERASGFPTVRAEAGLALAISEAMLGRFDDALEHVRQSVAALEDLGQVGSLVNGRTYEAWINRLAGDLPAAEAVLRVGLAEAVAAEDRSLESFVSCRLAEALVNQGRLAEAEVPLAVAERDRHAATETRIVGAHARIKAANGDRSALEDVRRLLQMVHEARRWPCVTSEAYIDAAYALAALGSPGEARHWLAEAVRLCEAKRNVPLAAQARSLATTFAG
jgi:class 3 adenylate cyclase/tetratricopeptide (TPR) repeat protein